MELINKLIMYFLQILLSFWIEYIINMLIVPLFWDTLHNDNVGGRYFVSEWLNKSVLVYLSCHGIVFLGPDLKQRTWCMWNRSCKFYLVFWRVLV